MSDRGKKLDSITFDNVLGYFESIGLCGLIFQEEVGRGVKPFWGFFHIPFTRFLIFVDWNKKGGLFKKKKFFILNESMEWWKFFYSDSAAPLIEYPIYLTSLNYEPCILCYIHRDKDGKVDQVIRDISLFNDIMDARYGDGNWTGCGGSVFVKDSTTKLFSIITGWHYSLANKTGAYTEATLTDKYFDPFKAFMYLLLH